jgi:hypothetical protein
MAVDFVSVNEGLVELFAGDEFVGAYRSPMMIVDTILKNGGPAPVIRCSSSWHHAVEYGFDSQFELEKIWDDVCSLL